MLTYVYEYVYFPPKSKQNTKKVNKTKRPWMTNCILKSVRNKNTLYKAFLRISIQAKMRICTKIIKIN